MPTIYLKSTQQTASITNLENELEKRIQHINSIFSYKKLPQLKFSDILSFTLKESDIKNTYAEMLSTTELSFVKNKANECAEIKRALLRLKQLDDLTKNNNQQTEELIKKIEEKFPDKIQSLKEEIGNAFTFNNVFYAKNTPIDFETIKELNLKDDIWFSKERNIVKNFISKSYFNLKSINPSIADSFFNALSQEAKRTFILSELKNLNDLIFTRKIVNGRVVLPDNNKLSESLKSFNYLLLNDNIKSTIKEDGFLQENMKHIYDKINKKFFENETDIFFEESELLGNATNFRNLYNNIQSELKPKSAEIEQDEFDVLK